MKEWCLQHPWMTFFIIIFIIVLIIFKNKNSVLGGKNKNTSNLKYEEVIKMFNNTKSNQNENETIPEVAHKSQRDYYNERGSQSVPTTLTSAPPKPPKQK